MKFHKFKLRHAQIIALCMAVYDFVTVIAAYGLALWIRFDCQYQQIPKNYFGSYLQNICFHAAACLLLYWLCYLYNSIWRFASYNELIRITIAASLTVAIHSIYMNVFVIRMPISYFVFGGVIQYVFSLGIRFGYRFILLFNYGKNNRTENCARVMIVGAGAAGQLIMRDISRTAEVKENVCCFIDDNPNKWRRSLDGIPVVGGRERILEACKNYKIDKIYVTIPSAARKEKQEILNICKESGCELKDLPEMYHLYTGNLSVSNMRNVTMEDLLGREPVSVNMDEIFASLHGKTILVTGGGGSIGSELCRQIASHQPGRLVIFDIYENNAYDIQMELLHDHPDLAVNVEIGSVRDSRRLFQLFDHYRPDIVYHAAAHKHVPLMEDSPCEAIKNNTIGTYKTAYAAMAHGCQRFVLISTDKAVNPSNVMGASKRLCEMVIQAFDHLIKAGRAADIPQLFTHPVSKASQTPDQVHHHTPAADTPAPQYAPCASSSDARQEAASEALTASPCASTLPLEQPSSNMTEQAGKPFRKGQAGADGILTQIHAPGAGNAPGQADAEEALRRTDAADSQKTFRQADAAAQGQNQSHQNPDLVQALRHASTEFVAVRFGNVLGSNGSVIPLFQKQIEAGGPVTVTHPDIVRYFMTIPEAVGLVLQAGVYAHGGEIFVLDMGEPVKIDTLARNLIYLSGYQPDVDMQIVYSGLRPGEKLYEEKLLAEEGLKKTDNDLIFIGCPVPFDLDAFLDGLKDLMFAAYKNDPRIRDLLKRWIPGFQQNVKAETGRPSQKGLHLTEIPMPRRKKIV